MMTIYLLGAVATALGACLHSRLLAGGGQMPTPGHVVGTALLAGILWPVVLLGVLQFGLVVAVQRAVRRHVAQAEPQAADLYETAPERSLVSV